MKANRQTIGVGVVGIGFGQAVHVPALRLDKRFEVKAICASSQERAEKVAEKLNIPYAYGQWEQLINNPHIHAITIATPPVLHHKIAVASLKAGKHVFCEKPLSVSLEKAEEMVKAVPTSDRANMIDLEFICVPEFMLAKQLLDEGAIGPLRHIHISWHVETYANRKGFSNWKMSIENGGGTLFSFCSHCFHYLEWFLGPLIKIQSFLYKLPDDTRSGDVLVQLNFEFFSGVLGSASVSTDSPGGCGHRIEFFCENGGLYLHNRTNDYINGFSVYIKKRDGIERHTVDAEKSIESGNDDSRIKVAGLMFKRFGDWIESGIPQRPDFEDGLRVQYLLDAAKRSHEAGGIWVKL